MYDSDTVAKGGFRLFFASLLGFEFLNGMGILHFPLTYTWQGLMVVAAFAWIAAEIVLANRKYVYAPLFLGLLSVSVFLDAFGDVSGFYATVRNYDKVLHFFNSGVITYLAYQTFRHLFERKDLPRFFAFLSLLSISALFGTLYEIEEFSEDVLVNHRQIRLGDGYDTAGDLSANVAGCAVTTLLLYALLRVSETKKEGRAPLAESPISPSPVPAEDWDDRERRPRWRP